MKTTDSADKATTAPKRRRRWLSIIKWTVGIIAGCVILLLLAVGAAVWILTPERLTPLVNKYASDYLDADVKASRFELTYWSTFPRLQLDVDSLSVVSHSLGNLDSDIRMKLPANADSLLSVTGLSAGINVLELLRGRIALYDASIDRPVVNLVSVSPTLTNYNIFPTEEEPDTTALVIPDFSFSKFTIQGNAPIRYFSLADSVDVSMTLSAINMNGHDAPIYKVDMSTVADATLSNITLRGLQFGLGGDIVWHHDSPYKIELNDFKASLNNINTITTAVVDFSDDLRFDKLIFDLRPVKVNEILAIVPPAMLGELSRLDNNLTVSLKAKLEKPYSLASDLWPTATVELDMPSGYLNYDRLRLNSVELKAKAYINGGKMTDTRIELERLSAIGQSVGFTLKAKISDPFGDPYIDGNFKGGIEFARLPAQLMDALGCTATGSLRADASFKLKQSWLSRDNFHRIKASGDMSLTNFRMAMPELEVDAYIRDARVKLGTSSSFVRGAVHIDSLLTMSVKIDTLYAAIPGMEARSSHLRAGIASGNRNSSADTTRLNPIGAVMAIGRLNLIDLSDSTRLRLRDFAARASLRRYRNSRRMPLLSLNVEAKRMRYADSLNRASLTDAKAQLSLHPSIRKPSPRMKHYIDSLRQLYPDSPRDSIRRMAARHMRQQRAMRRGSLPIASSTAMDYGLDDETKSLLRRWRVDGRLTARRARAFTPYFPLRNKLSDIDLEFNSDSITVNNTRVNTGRSDFLIDGSITNITRAMTSRSGRQSLMINFRVTADTVDVNQIAAAIFAGAAFAEKERRGMTVAIADSDDDLAIERSVAAQTDSTDAGPLLIPTNIDATLRLNARNVLYSDFLFHNLRGSIEVFDGAINMRNLSARTDIGAIDLTALYQGVDPQKLDFAFGMQVRNFHVARFLDLVPALDTIMPLLTDMDGVINGEIAARTALDSTMNLRIPTLNAAVTLRGDSLVLLDAETFRKVGKWMLFKNKDRNVIDSMTVKLVVANSIMQLYPFMFNIDRYKLGVYGNNDLDLNFKYHVAVLKSPIPFKFGINVSGTPDKMKIRLGGAKWDEKSATSTFAIADTTRVNLVKQIQGLFRRGVRNAALAGDLHLDDTPAASIRETFAGADTISKADSLIFIREGLIPAPDTIAPMPTDKKRR